MQYPPLTLNKVVRKNMSLQRTADGNLFPAKSTEQVHTVVCWVVTPFHQSVNRHYQKNIESHTAQNRIPYYL
jgi:hypothetical protein